LFLGIKEESTLLLRNFYKTEEIFLDMFEDEYRETTKSWKNDGSKIEFILSDASLLLPPTGTPLTGIEFTKRLPCGEVERARKAIRTFFSLRQLSLDLQEREETQLPLSSPDSCVQVHEVLDLNNSDLLAVSVTSTSSNSTFSLGSISEKSTTQLSGNQLKHRFFLVIGTYQIVLVEPDATRLGWGVAIFAGFLQDLEVLSDKEDSR
jgi:protein CLEC16A